MVAVGFVLPQDLEGRENMKYSREAVVIGAAVVTSIAGAEPFTYQGVLQESGMAADGAYDIRFELYDSSNKSVQIGPRLTFDDLAVAEGVFQVDLDFGNGVFDGSARFLFIEVRDGASTGGYSGLLPTIEITATPEAQHALTADTVLNPQWTEAPGVLTYGDGNDRVFINRSSPITTTEYFGVHGNTTGFVGMYVSGPAGSVPFYGYSVDDQINAFTFVDPNTSDWILVNNGDTALISDSSQNLTVAGDTVADSFQYSSPKTSYLSVPASAFHSTSNQDYTYNFGFGSVRITNASNAKLVAPVQLPHGASITGMRVYGFDNSAIADVTIELIRFANTKSLLTISSVSTFGSPIAFELIDSINPPVVVDNSSHSYSLSIASVNWPGNILLDVQNIVIEYTTTEAD